MQVAILGAECTGKTTLAQALVSQLNSVSDPWTFVPEVLRQWCDRNLRTPQAEEQQAIAVEQAAQAVLLANTGCSVVADTTPLMTAIYSDILFGDCSLYDFALDHQRSYDLILLASVDVPWSADGIQRDGIKARKMIDQKLRQILQTQRLQHTLVYGQGQVRTQTALEAIAHHKKTPGSRSAHETTWRWTCDTCSDAQCEHKMFSKLL
jgi:HTH-type transcriptional repressor of NAD biosynthesis genes